MIAQPELIRLNPDRHIPKKDSSFVLCIEEDAGILQRFLTETIQSHVMSMPVIIAPPLLFATGDFTGGIQMHLPAGAGDRLRIARFLARGSQS